MASPKTCSVPVETSPGVTTFDPEQTGRQLQMLKAVGPGLQLETASHHELAINLAAARHLGVAVPAELLARPNQTVK